MQERSFIIDINHEEVEFFYELDESCVQSICENTLDIPRDYIRKIECYEDRFRLSLIQSRSYYREDWYVNLQRLDYVS